MIWYHFMYDVRYIFNYDAFIFFESFVFQNIIHPLLLIGLFMMSGISQSFSHNHLKRIKNMILLAASITIISSLISMIFQIEIYFFWQITHSLSVCIAITILIEKMIKDIRLQIIAFLTLAMLFLFILPFIFEKYNLAEQASPWLLPLGIGYKNPQVPDMGDYLPIIPYGGFFFIGSVLGKILYPEGLVNKESFKNPIWKPLRFLGKNSLLVYAIHQPILLLLIWLYGRFCL